jgi:hypothetical protein
MFTHVLDRRARCVTEYSRHKPSATVFWLAGRRSADCRRANRRSSWSKSRFGGGSFNISVVSVMLGNEMML